MLALLHESEDVGQARDCCSLEHLLCLPRESGRRYFLDETEEKEVLESFPLQVCGYEHVCAQGSSEDVDFILILLY